VRLFRPKRDAPAADEATQPGQPRRRRRAPRADGPRTIVPLDDAALTPLDRPSWLPADAPRAAAAAPAPSPFALDVDAARDRLRRQIPPVDDDR
jgi:hypothetical protein